MQATRKTAPLLRASLLGLATLAALGLAALHPQVAQAQTTVNGTYSATNAVDVALRLSSGGNQSSGPSATPAKDAGNSYLFTGGTYSSTGIIGSALQTNAVTATINSGAFTTGSFNTLYLGNSTVTVNGGTFTKISGTDSSAVQSYATNLSVYGGTFTQPGTGFFIDGTSTNTFYGDFAPQTITNAGAAQLSGMFSGTLVNGGPRQTFSYLISQGGTLRLVNPNATMPAPEPSSVAAFAFTGLGAAGLILKARRRRMVA